MRQGKFVKIGGGICLYFAFCNAVISEELDIKKEPVVFPVGPFEFSPLLEIGETFNDNIFQKNSEQKGSFLTQIHAGGQLALKRQLNHYELTYALQSSHYHSSPQDDYVDNFVGASTHTEFTSRNRLDLDFSYLDSHYQRGYFLGRDITGSTTTNFKDTEPDQYHSYDLEATYRYGRKEAKGNLELQLDFNDTTFDNNPDSTASLDRTRIKITPGFYYRLFPKTTLHAQVESTWTNHKQQAASAYDNSKQRFLVGGTWLYSAQTQATAKIGYIHQAYDNSSLNTFDGITWDLNLSWSFLSYSKINLSISRDANPSIGSSNVRTSDRYRIGWSHQWTDRISTQVTAAYENANNLTIQRQDEYKSFGIDINYGLKRWLGVGINYTYRGLQSTYSVPQPDRTLLNFDQNTIDNPSLNFDQNTILLYVTANPRLSDEINTPWASWY